jgi:hypothetical protein
MAEKKGFVDIWVVETNVIYRDVPYTVVTDWIQQGRLLAEDKVRPSGLEEWQRLAEAAAFQVYFPKPEPERADDPAEALAPVEPEFAWKASSSEEDDDVDMIPLIDVSLVLLIFFMMTAAVSSGVLSPISTPPAKYELETVPADMYWVGIDIQSPSGKVEKDSNGWPVLWYSMGKGDGHFNLLTEFQLQEDDLRGVDEAELKGLPEKAKQALIDKKGGLAQVRKKFLKELEDVTGEVRVRVRAHKSIDIEIVQQLVSKLHQVQVEVNPPPPAARKVSINISGEVSSPQQ